MQSGEFTVWLPLLTLCVCVCVCYGDLDYFPLLRFDGWLDAVMLWVLLVSGVRGKGRGCRNDILDLLFTRSRW